LGLPELASRPSTGVIDPTLKSVVAHIRAPLAIDGLTIHPRLPRDMVEEGLRMMTGKDQIADAWHSFLKPDDVIGIKFNQVGFESLATAAPLARHLVESLGAAGFAPERIMLVEVPPKLAHALKTRPAVIGWSGEAVSFGSGQERLSAVLQEVTALINVPFLKTHNIAGMTGCLKNLSHALVHRPGRYHANACAPFVGDILSLPQIRSKLRLHIVNALRAVYRGGPDAAPDNIWPHSGILISQDPVAADQLGIDIINEQRAIAKLPRIGDADAHIPHVHHAAQRGLGTDDQDYIELMTLRLS
jgi:hypothetical protein